MIEEKTFADCRNLRNVEIAEGTERIEYECFRGSRLEEITLPSTLKEMGSDVFRDCSDLETVWVEEGCALDVREHVADSVVILPVRPTENEKRLRDFRGQKHVTIPERTERIGERQFMGSEV